MADRRAAAGSTPPGTVPSQRIDKFLWFARITKSRSIAQALAERGVIRLNGRRVERAHSAVRIGDLVTVPYAGTVQVLRILRLPARRGPAEEARACYDTLQLGDGTVTGANNDDR
jgi:ribosome-associated heat shock protein Hsp15